MGEIKSAIELAMEKTKDLRLSREEIERFKEEEIHSKAHGLVNRFLEVDFHFREVEKELLKYTPEQREHLEKLMLQYLCDAIQLDRDNDLIFQGIEALRQNHKGPTEKIRQLIAGYQKRKGQEYQKVEKDLLAKFDRLGISGSAVQPKIEGSQEWDDALARFKPSFDSPLRLLKEELKK